MTAVLRKLPEGQFTLLGHCCRWRWFSSTAGVVQVPDINLADFSNDRIYRWHRTAPCLERSLSFAITQTATASKMDGMPMTSINPYLNVKQTFGLVMATGFSLVKLHAGPSDPISKRWRYPLDKLTDTFEIPRWCVGANHNPFNKFSSIPRKGNRFG